MINVNSFVFFNVTVTNRFVTCFCFQSGATSRTKDGGKGSLYSVTLKVVRLHRFAGGVNQEAEQVWGGTE
jgi:hypothetical protein